MSVLVTGGTGFVGIHVTAQLAESGESVVAFSAEGELDDVARDFLGPARERVTCVKGDVLDLESLRATMDSHGADRVIHGAAITAIGDLEPEAARQAALVNVGGTATVLEAARLAGVKRFVHLSSASVYGAADPRVPLDEEAPLEPNGIYGITKRAGEDIVRRYLELFGVDGVILRLSAPYGPLERPNPLRTVMSPVFHWCRAALNGDEVELADDLERDLTYVSDTARCVVLAFQSSKLRHGVYNASCGENLRFSDILAALARVRPGFRFRLKEGGQTVTVLPRQPSRGPVHGTGENGSGLCAAVRHRERIEPLSGMAGRASNLAEGRVVETGHGWNNDARQSRNGHSREPGCVKTPTSRCERPIRHSRPLRHSRESGNPGVVEGCYSGVSPLHPAWIPAFAGMTISGGLCLAGMAF